MIYSLSGELSGPLPLHEATSAAFWLQQNIPPWGHPLGDSPKPQCPPQLGVSLNSCLGAGGSRACQDCHPVTNKGCDHNPIKTHYGSPSPRRGQALAGAVGSEKTPCADGDFLPSYLHQGSASASQVIMETPNSPENSPEHRVGGWQSCLSHLRNQDLSASLSVSAWSTKNIHKSHFPWNTGSSTSIQHCPWNTGSSSRGMEARGGLSKAVLS